MAYSWLRVLIQPVQLRLRYAAACQQAERDRVYPDEQSQRHYRYFLSHGFENILPDCNQDQLSNNSHVRNFGMASQGAVAKIRF